MSAPEAPDPDLQRRCDAFPASRFHAFLRDRLAQPASTLVWKTTGVDCFALAVVVGHAARLVNAAGLAAALALAGRSLAGHGDPLVAVPAAVTAACVAVPVEFLCHAVIQRVGHLRDRFGDDGHGRLVDPVYRPQPVALGFARLLVMALILGAVMLDMTLVYAAWKGMHGEWRALMLVRWGGSTAALAGFAASLTLAGCERPPRPPSRTGALSPSAG